MKRKIVALLLVALICVSLFTLAACNNEKGQGGGGTTPTNEFNVVFTVGANVYSYTVKSGEAIPYDKVTLPQGATLTGLYSDAEMTVSVDKTTKVTADMRLWVDWEYIPYTLTFDAAGGEGTYDPATVYAGDIVDVPAMPTRDGYVFAYWYDAEEGEDSAFDFANDRVPERNLTLVAKWNIVSNAGFYGGTADGNPHDAVTLNVYDDAAFVKQYSLDGGEWTEQVPQITEVGVYKVAYRVLDGETVVEEGEGSAINIGFIADDYDWSVTSGTNEITLVGKHDLSDLTLSLAGISVSMSSVDLGFSHRFRLHIGDGTTPTEVAFPYNYKMLTGSQITVEKNAVMNVQGRFMVYTEFTDSDLDGVIYAVGMPSALFAVNGTVNFANGSTFGGRITGEENGGKVVFGADTTLSMTTVEGNCGKTTSFFGIGGTFFMTNTTTEEARFDEGVLRVSTDTTKTNEKEYSYVERIRSYEAQQKLSLGTTYLFDGLNWTAQ